MPPASAENRPIPASVWIAGSVTVGLVGITTVLGIILRAGISSAFFRFYFDATDPEARRTVLRTSFWFTMGGGTLGLALLLVFAGSISDVLFGTANAANLVPASAKA